MDRRKFVQTAAGSLASLAVPCIGAASGTAKHHTQSKRPNVIFILPDEWRAQALGCMGNPDVQTPHLDKLASEGLLLRNTLANTPVCCPARANLLTGTYTSTNGMVANDLRLLDNLTSYADVFDKAGYRTAYIGKWHLDGGPRLPGYVPPGRRHGFQYWAANECNHNYFNNIYFKNSDVPVHTTEYEPVFWTDLALEFLHEAQHEPFFMVLAPGAPHDPYVAPKEYIDRYDPDKITLEPNWVAGARKSGRKEIAAYYAAITAIDDQMGRLLGTLHELGLEDNTIILFSSDHGNMLGSQETIFKRKPYEESIRVPGIMRCPRLIPGGRTTDALFSHVDFAPTLLSLCGLPVPTSMQGTDLSPVIRNEKQAGPTEAFFQIFGPNKLDGVTQGWRGLRTERYMYARYEASPWVLYDLHKDPYELTNLVSDAGSKSILDDLDKRLLAFMHKIGDSWSLNWTGPIEDSNALYSDRTFYTLDEYAVWAKTHPDAAKQAAQE